ncbi:7437_t:CDS:2, partial [Rhizophagus irregularis]
DNRKKNKKAYTIFADLKKKIILADDEIGYLQLEEIDLEAVYACSTASKRLFSNAGNILTAKRTRTCPNFFKKLIFLKRNGKHLNSIHGESSQES